MRRIIFKIAWRYCYLGESILRKSLWQKIYTNGIKLVCAYLLIINCYLRRYFGKIGVLPKDNSLPIISLTSYPQRINTLWMVIDSIYYQTLLPQKIVLVLTKEEFPDGLVSLPYSIKRYLNKGLEIVFTDYNLRPHNKYYYSLKHIKENDVITVDDDLLYWPNTIELLYDIKKTHPDCICANRATQVYEKDGHLSFRPKYNSKGHSFIARGTGGVLYPPMFRPESLFDQEMIKRLSLNTDDNWLKVHEMKYGIEVATGDFYPHPLVLPGSQRRGLHRSNQPQELSIHDRLLTAYDLRDNYNARFVN